MVLSTVYGAAGLENYLAKQHFLTQKKTVITKNQDIKKLNVVVIYSLNWTIFDVEREAAFLRLQPNICS